VSDSCTYEVSRSVAADRNQSLSLLADTPFRNKEPLLSRERLAEEELRRSYVDGLALSVQAAANSLREVVQRLLDLGYDRGTLVAYLSPHAPMPANLPILHSSFCLLHSLKPPYSGVFMSFQGLNFSPQMSLPRRPCRRYLA
jgi:hypothetical protein